MAALIETPTGLAVGQLALRMGLKAGTVQRYLDELERQGIVRRFLMGARNTPERLPGYRLAPRLEAAIAVRLARRRKIGRGVEIGPRECVREEGQGDD